ncbi:hypothetical protein NPA31_007130 [Aurantimonas sp. MSK8Z-1]|uniref:hypothetical protein n=1 Tax=Mangrovibrevibacter kandeliae TaxID=2968473 RepID=UPI002118EDB2|nr:hypothetical protein [Aurantimonas sp. MSK8Z-1]MCW4114734.1 hypothetical protein [Aurantimonas sp. MSK8Z-1]
MRKRLILLAAAVTVATPALAADALDIGAESVELYMYRHSRWDPVDCEGRDLDGERFVLCQPWGSKDLGALFLIRRKVGGVPVVYTVNGTAKQAVPETTIPGTHGYPVAVEPWLQQPSINIQITLRRMRAPR